MASKKLAATISFFASRLFFLLIIFQIPLFRFPCRIGVCRTPIEVTSSQLIAADLIPVGVVKAFLYPGAIAKAIIKNKPIPAYSNILNFYNLKNIKNSPQRTDLEHIEVLAGSYLAVVGAILGLFRSRRLGLFGVVLIIWGLAKDQKKGFSICYPSMTGAFFCAFFSIRGDVRKTISCFKWTFFKAKQKNKTHLSKRCKSHSKFIS